MNLTSVQAVAAEYRLAYPSGRVPVTEDDEGPVFELSGLGLRLAAPRHAHESTLAIAAFRHS